MRRTLIEILAARGHMRRAEQRDRETDGGCKKDKGIDLPHIDTRGS